jgi:long-chain acyl-CoA synthetase
MVVGDAKPFIACLVTLDPEALPGWLKLKSKDESLTAAQMAEDPELLAEVQSAVDEANKAVSQAEAIRKFRVLTEDWTEEGGQMTPSLKLKRSVVMKQYTDAVEELYAGSDR